MWIAVGQWTHGFSAGFSIAYNSYTSQVLLLHDFIILFIRIHNCAIYYNTNNSVCVNILHRQKENVHYSITPIDAVVLGFPGGSNKSLYNTNTQYNIIIIRWCCAPRYSNRCMNTTPRTVRECGTPTKRSCAKTIEMAYKLGQNCRYYDYHS